jgi:hypothetical protein
VTTTECWPWLVEGLPLASWPGIVSGEPTGTAVLGLKLWVGERQTAIWNRLLRSALLTV